MKRIELKNDNSGNFYYHLLEPSTMPIDEDHIIAKLTEDRLVSRIDASGILLTDIGFWILKIDAKTDDHIELLHHEDDRLIKYVDK